MQSKNKRKREGDQKLRYVFGVDWGNWRRWIQRREIAAADEEAEQAVGADDITEPETREPTPFEQAISDAHEWRKVDDETRCMREDCGMSLAYAIAAGWNVCPGDPEQREAFEAENRRREGERRLSWTGKGTRTSGGRR